MAAHSKVKPLAWIRLLLALDPPRAVTAAGKVIHDEGHRISIFANLFSLKLNAVPFHGEGVIAVRLAINAQPHAVTTILAKKFLGLEK